jgi:hypothetical protein
MIAQMPPSDSPVPVEVRALAQRRAVARAERDFAAADSLRAAISAAGWLVRDTPTGFELVPKPPYDLLGSLNELHAAADTGGERPARRATAGLLVEGWPDDVRSCVDSLIKYAPQDLVVSIIEAGDVDGAGVAVHELVVAHPDRVEAWHIAGPVGWGAARRALLLADPADVHVLMDVSTILDGDAISPLLDALAEPGVAAAGWRGANVDIDDAWRSVHGAGPGEVDVLLGYLMAVRKDAAMSVGGPDAKARYYRNADLEFSLMLREAGGRLVVPSAELPCHQGRHHGYHDTDPGYGERESRRNYERLLRRFRGRTDLLAPR